jgi:hypothetical protein
MKKDTKYIGIDYGMGKTNIDLVTGIRYGVISQYLVLGDALDEMQSDYGDPRCPKCDNEAVSVGDGSVANLDLDAEGWTHAKHECDEFVCVPCRRVFGGESAYGDEPHGYYTDDGAYKVTCCLDSDLMVILSPYYTRAQFCSPCCPGAGNLDSPSALGPKTYCLGPDWFEDDQVPYPVYRVDNDTLVSNPPLSK